MSLPPEKASELKQIIHNHLLKVSEERTFYFYMYICVIKQGTFVCPKSSKAWYNSYACVFLFSCIQKSNCHSKMMANVNLLVS